MAPQRGDRISHRDRDTQQRPYYISHTRGHPVGEPRIREQYSYILKAKRALGSSPTRWGKPY
jgi:hypothetical protein